MKVLQKTLILLLIPLLFEAVLIIVLIFQSTQLEDETRRILAQRSLGQSVALLFSAYMAATDSVYWLQGKPNSSNHEKFRAYMQRVQTLQVEARRQIKAHNLEGHPAVAKLLRVSEYVGSKLVPYKEMIEERRALTADQIIDLVRNCNSMTLVLDECGQSARDLWEWERKQSQNSERLQRSKKEAMHTTLVVGLFGNLLLSVLMAVWFNHTTITRLRLIMGNARLIGNQAPLVVSVAGQDEFSELDLVLHKVSELMAESRKQELQAKTMKEDFYAMVTHDLRSPITSVGVALELLLDGAKGPLSDTAIDALSESSRNLERVYRLVNDFLDLRKLDAEGFEINLKPVSVELIVAQCTESIADIVQEKALRLKVSADSISIKADETSLSRILSNILSFVLAGATDKEEVEINVRRIEKQPGARFEVRSFGKSIEPSERENLFTAFQTSASTERSGLTLAIARLLVELHGGEIGVEENKPSGNIFWFSIPE
ncbi:MAG: HAMP domain-containing histidine kinase [Candidatus Obscuribacterales bacterium]|nr:HAMP domain-containing histidine kinase [Candidatus Obscuribacterales bacterium]